MNIDEPSLTNNQVKLIIMNRENHHWPSVSPSKDTKKVVIEWGYEDIVGKWGYHQ